MSLPAAALAQTSIGPSAQTAHARVTLIAGRPSAAGVWTGLHFTLQPGWHIHWRNPGDSGGPPTVQWRLPQGVTAGPLLWPAPERIPVGPLVNYGYHDEVTLPVLLSSGSRTMAGVPSIGAEVRWLICKDVCLNERASLRLSNTVDVDGLRGASASIDRARASVPAVAPATWVTKGTTDGRHFYVSVRTDRLIGSATFFPLDESQIDDAAIQDTEITGNAVRFTLKHSDQLLKVPAALRGIITLDGAAYEIAVAIGRQ
jgi:DsbC/DsbD-like thiol-disulfide interchange protein